MKPFLAVFDLDGTLTTETSAWQYVLERTDKWEPEGRNNLDKFLRGILPGSKDDQYRQFCGMDAALLQGVKYNGFLRILGEIKFRPNIRPLITFLKTELAASVIIVSSGFQELAEAAQELYGVDRVYANKLGSENGLLDGTFIINVPWHGKREVLKTIKNGLNIERSQILSFGDSSGDIEMFKESVLSFACFTSNREVLEYATHYLDDFSKAKEIIKESLC